MQSKSNVLYTNVPNELKTLRQWVLWKSEVRNGKTTKVPYQINGKHAKSNDALTWTDYTSACRTYVANQNKWNGISFVFTQTDPFCGVDLDDCLENQQLKNWAVPIIEKLKSISYGEVSPSGNGIKFWTRATLTTGAKHKAYVTAEGVVCKQGGNTDGAIEAYDNARFFTVTGKGKYKIKNGQQAIDWLCEKYLKPHPKEKHTYEQGTQKNSALNLSANETVEKIQQSRQVHKFNALMNGNIIGYSSNSEADMALCSTIAFWTQDPTTIDTIFRQSALMRPKWDETHRSDGATYGEITIEKVLSSLNQTYTPQSKHRQNIVMDIAYTTLRGRKYR